MKKLILLFTMACASSQLYGMEAKNIMDLPEDVRNKIISMALPSSDNLDETIKVIKAGVLRGVRYDNLKNFTALMNLLAKKFPNVSREKIAEKFNTDVAKEYVTLGEQLLGTAKGRQSLFTTNKPSIPQRGKESPGKYIKELLEKGVDPNYKGEQIGYPALELTYSAILDKELEYENGTATSKYENGAATLKLLLDAGAKPTEGFMLYEQARVKKEEPPAELRKELFNLLKQYTDK